MNILKSFINGLASGTMLTIALVTFFAVSAFLPYLIELISDPTVETDLDHYNRFIPLIYLIVGVSLSWNIGLKCRAVIFETSYTSNSAIALFLGLSAPLLLLNLIISDITYFNIILNISIVVLTVLVLKIKFLEPLTKRILGSVFTNEA